MNSVFRTFLPKNGVLLICKALIWQGFFLLLLVSMHSSEVRPSPRCTNRIWRAGMGSVSSAKKPSCARRLCANRDGRMPSGQRFESGPGHEKRQAQSRTSPPHLSAEKLPALRPPALRGASGSSHVWSCPAPEASHWDASPGTVTASAAGNGTAASPQRR